MMLSGRFYRVRPGTFNTGISGCTGVTGAVYYTRSIQT